LASLAPERNQGATGSITPKNQGVPVVRRIGTSLCRQRAIFLEA